MYFKVRHPSISSSHSQNYVKDSNYYQDFDENGTTNSRLEDKEKHIITFPFSNVMAEG